MDFVAELLCKIFLRHLLFCDGVREVPVVLKWSMTNESKRLEILMDYQISLPQVQEILLKNQLLKEIIIDGQWHYGPSDKICAKVFHHISYDSREVDSNSLFFCKGLHFKESYLTQAISQGLGCYVSENYYEQQTAIAVIVTDIRESMVVLAQAFYQNPQERLFTIAITGTKGKTTTAYLTHQLINQMTHHKCALFSSEETILDGKTKMKSTLSTPEALVIYHQMAQAVENHMTHLVMEVSSQAYKTKRVFGLSFDVGLFLNIGHDHISPIEHPTFEDYLYCKRQLILHSKQMILNADIPYFDLLVETCQQAEVEYLTFSDKSSTADYLYKSQGQHDFYLKDYQSNQEQVIHLGLVGEFNHANATAAIIATRFVDAQLPLVQAGKWLSEVSVPGRMNAFYLANGALVLVDYAHNYLSLKAVSHVAKQLKPEGKLIILTGSAGGKALSRRPDMGKAISEEADVAILTADDPDFESVSSISEEIKAAITNPNVQVILEENRKEAILKALTMSDSQTALVLAGKGDEKTIKVKGQEIPYESDIEIVNDYMNNEKRYIYQKDK